MTELDAATVSIAALMDLFHAAVDAIRPGARYVMVATNEDLSVTFCDHGGAISVTHTGISSGPRVPHSSNPHWVEPHQVGARLNISAEGGDVANRPRVVHAPLPPPASAFPPLGAGGSSSSIDTTGR